MPCGLLRYSLLLVWAWMGTATHGWAQVAEEFAAGYACYVALVDAVGALDVLAAFAGATQDSAAPLGEEGGLQEPVAGTRACVRLRLRHAMPSRWHAASWRLWGGGVFAACMAAWPHAVSVCLSSRQAGSTTGVNADVVPGTRCCCPQPKDAWHRRKGRAAKR